MKKRIVIAAGGTGGHFYPGLVLAKTLRARGWEALMLAKRGDAALATLDKEGLAALEVDISGMPRRPGPELLRFGWRLTSSVRLLLRALRDFSPNAVVGMGGYLTFPALFAAWRLGIPRAVHESNCVLGLANQASVALGAGLFWGLPPAEGGGTVTGTPIRPALWKTVPQAEARKRLGLAVDKPTVLLFGGSQGAKGVNEQAPAALKNAAQAAPNRLQVLHLAGRERDASVRLAYKDAPLHADIRPYLDDMEAAYGAADVVVCRSGASTLAELWAQKKPAVLIPLPTAAANHQEANARLLEKAGACAVILERDLQARLSSLLADLLLSSKGGESLARMSGAFGRIALPAPDKCAETLADSVEKLAFDLLS